MPIVVVGALSLGAGHPAHEVERLHTHSESYNQVRNVGHQAVNVNSTSSAQDDFCWIKAM